MRSNRTLIGVLDMFLIIANQIIKMFLIMVVGFICFRTGQIDHRGNKTLSNLLLMIINPFLIINAFQLEYSAHLMQGFLLSFLLAFLNKEEIIVAAALSLIASLGDMMPPTALAGIFAAQVVGLEKYTPVLKKCLVPCLMIIVWGILFILGANVLEPFIILT